MNSAKKYLLFAIFCFCFSFPGSTQDLGEYNKQEIKDLTDQVQDQIRFLQYFLNTVGNKETSARDKDVIIRESFRKIFRDDQVQVEDDLLLDRKVITNKAITAYLKDVDFFFKDVNFTFKVREIKPHLKDNGELYFQVALDRTLEGIGINNENVENTRERFVEINWDKDAKELKIASIYTTKLSRDEELQEWWESLSYQWDLYFRERFGVDEEDSVLIDQIYKFSSIDSLDLSGNKVIVDLGPIHALRELKYLNISGTNIEELGPISNVTFLTHLDISNTPANDIQFIKYSDRISYLDISDTEINSIDDLANLKNLKVFRAARTPLIGFGVINNFINLEQLDLQESGFNNVENINELTNLKSLNLRGNFLINFGFLGELESLEEINLEETNILDLAPLADLKNLWRININKTEVSSLAPLSGSSNIRRIYADRTSITEEDADNFARTNRRILLIHNVENLQTWWETLPEGWNKMLAKIYPDISKSAPTVEELTEMVGIDSLNLSNGEIVSLRPALKFKKVFYLAFDNTKVNDLSPLAEMKTLTQISGENSAVTNVEALGKLDALERLSLKGSNIGSIGPLKSLTSLQLLNLDDTEVPAWEIHELTRELSNTIVIFQTEELTQWWENLNSDWKTILKDQFDLPNTPSSKELHKMTASDNVSAENVGIEDLEPLLAFFNLRELSIHNAPIRDISAVGRMENLNTFRLSQTPLRDLSPIANLSYLETLDVSNTGVEDLRPLADLNRLRKLNLSGTNIRRLRGLDTLYDLRELDIASTNVRNINPIMHLVNLEKLVCFNTRINRRRIEKFQKNNPECEVRFY
ncbi:leucine-rich repeat domain-containing protein [Pleomorphovibrio marinus]|uniref:leucine-rich repeat domain-containing protein n=1 Tax=Pleomorphovibrio marinus TaxID=2164132 RepID=UPI001E5929A8|nr:leucine-rich repeat domain-containing protein [Pleomorphovibrio marinus]